MAESRPGDITVGGGGGSSGGGGGGGAPSALSKLTQHAQDIIRLTRETEILQSFLRVDAGERDDTAGAIRRRLARRSPVETGAGTTDAAPSAVTATAAVAPASAVSVESAGEGPTERTSRVPRPSSPSPKKALSFTQLKKEMKLQRQAQAATASGEEATGGGGGRGRRRGRARRKRQEVRQEEIYTDKDRAAAVAAGSRDIKQSLKLKRKQDRSRALQIPEEAEPGSLLALGARELKTGDVRVAIGFVHKALELNPRDKNALVARSRCYLLLGEPQLALADAETALRPDKTFIRAIFQKAEALYHLGDFEHALVYYHRGLRLRPELEHFRLGVQKAQEAIENTIGGKTFPGLPAEYYLLPLSERPGVTFPASTTPALPSPCDSAATPSSAAAAITPSVTLVATTSTIASPTTGAAAGIAVRPASSATGSARTLSETARVRRQARHLLGELCVDKDYLEQLLRHPDIKCLHQDKADHISSHAKEGVEFLTNRQEFWRQQKSTAPPNSAKNKRQQHRNGAH